METVPADGSFRPKAHSVRIPLVGERPPIIEWYAVDVASARVTRLAFPYDKLLALQQDLVPLPSKWWGPDHRHLYAVGFGDNMESSYLFDADIETGQVRTVIEESRKPRVDLNSTSYNPPNVHITADGRQALWWSERDGWGHLYRYDIATGRLLGAEMVGPAAEHLGHLLAWSLQNQMTIAQMLEMPFYHPVIEEGLRTALRHLDAKLRLAQVSAKAA